MIFTNFTRVESDLVILFKNTTAIQNIHDVNYFIDNTSGSFAAKEVRWSFDNSSWTSWATLSQPTIADMVMVGKILYLEIRYTLSKTSSGTVTSFKLYYSDLPLVQQDPALPAPRATAVTIELEAPVVVDTTGAGDDLLTGLFAIPTFSNFVRTTSGLEIKFKNLRPIYYVEQINVFIDDSDGTFQKKEFRWSFNNSYWASWEPLAPANISGIKIYPNKYLYLEVRYVQASEDSGTATSFSIQYKELSVDQYPVTASQADAAAVATDQGTACDVREVTRTNVYDIYDANLLEGKDGDYYLWRANHKGTQGIPTIQGLQEYLNIIGAAISALDPCTAVAAADNVSVAIPPAPLSFSNIISPLF